MITATPTTEVTSIPHQSRASTSTLGPTESPEVGHTDGISSQPGNSFPSTGALVGIVVGAAVFTILLASLMYTCGKLRQKGKQESSQVTTIPEATRIEPWDPYKGW